ncbi:hypothetical protein [Ekhidna sp.]|uniref:hypothetical protein n=1 Tax=Ekhidna sp. TaxID=2608089 RepID=UPI0035114142
MKNLLLITTLFFIVSCGPSQEEELQQLKDEVMTIHDEVMPKMGELRRIRKDLLLQADSLIVVDSARAALLTTIATQIGDANEGMMQWMRDFEPEFEGTDDEIRQYLEDQKIAIQQVKEDMNKSLAKGKEVLGD